MKCLTCHYDLTNLREHRCPECGRAFDPQVPNTYWSQLVEVERCRRCLRSATACALYAPVFTALIAPGLALLALSAYEDVLFRAPVGGIVGVLIAAVPVAQITCVGLIGSVLLAPKELKRALKREIIRTLIKVFFLLGGRDHRIAGNVSPGRILSPHIATGCAKVRLCLM